MNIAIVPKPNDIAHFVFFVRGEKVMLDVDLANLYGVTTKALNQAMSRNKSRFPIDFAFRLTATECDALREGERARERSETDAVLAERIVVEALKSVQWREIDLVLEPKGHPIKARIAKQLKDAVLPRK